MGCIICLMSARKPPLDVFLKQFLGSEASPEILEKRCTKDSKNLLRLVSKNTSVSPQHLGRSLDLSAREISDILNAYSDNLTEQKYQVLLEWISKTGHEATYHRLILVLYDSDDLSTTEMACQMIASEDSWTTPFVPWPHPVDSMSVSPRPLTQSCASVPQYHGHGESRPPPPRHQPPPPRHQPPRRHPPPPRHQPPQHPPPPPPLHCYFEVVAAITVLPPDAQKCTLLQRPDYAYVNVISHVTLTIKDRKGVEVVWCEASDVTASLRCILSDSITDCRISEDHMARDTAFKISYMAETRGRFELHVKVKGEHIRESPFALFAKVAPTTLGKPVMIIRGVKQPTSVAIGPNSECVVVEMSTSRVAIFNNSGKKIKTLEIDDASTRLFLAPSGVSLDGSGNIYVVDQQKIMKISPMGKLTIASPYPQGGFSSVEMPSSISVAPSSTLHVCCPSNNEIITLDTELKLTATTGGSIKSGSIKSGNFLHPRNIAFDTKGGRIRSFITDQGNHQVQVLDDQSGKHLFNIKAAANQKPWMPCGIFVDPRTELVYVTDLGNHQISIFFSSGEHVHSFGCEGKGPGEFSSPTGIAVDMDGFVYVCDSSNDCIQVF